jgi:hypothetical protein
MKKTKNKRESKEGKSFPLFSILSLLVGAIVSLSVGFGMINKVLTIPAIPSVITVATGYIVVLATFLTVILAVFNK